LRAHGPRAISISFSMSGTCEAAVLHYHQPWPHSGIRLSRTRGTFNSKSQFRGRLKSTPRSWTRAPTGAPFEPCTVSWRRRPSLGDRHIFVTVDLLGPGARLEEAEKPPSFKTGLRCSIAARRSGWEGGNSRLQISKVGKRPLTKNRMRRSDY